MFWKILILGNRRNNVADVEEFENFDLQNIITPIDVQAYHELLLRSKYDRDKSNYLLEGFTKGFSIQYRGHRNRRNSAKNIPLTVGSKAELLSKIMKEVKMKRYTGPFENPPFQYFVQSPIGLVPKDNGKQTRLIFHLSYDFNDQDKSINHYTPEDVCTMKYLDVAIDYCLRLMSTSPTTKTIFYSKSDLKSAFRLVPCRVSDFPLLLMRGEHPVTGKSYWFADKALPFGHSIFCALFQSFSDSLQHITQFLIGHDFCCVNYLDDFLFLSDDEQFANVMVRIFLQLCKHINCPVSLEKTEWASSTMIFLGVMLNGDGKVLSVPEDKRIKAQKLLNWVLDRKKITIHCVQRLMGILNFLNKAVVPGRAFTRKMYLKLKLCDNKGNRLKQYHHIKLDTEFLQDCKVWTNFLDHTNSEKIC